MSMKTQLSSLDIHFVLKELKDLEGARVDRIYGHGKEEYYIQFHKSNIGKKILRIIVGNAIFLTEEKSVDETPSGFCTFLRKHLEGKFLDSIEQIEPERILKLVFKSKEDEKNLYLELFGKGNIILCNNEEIIIDCLIHHKFRDRSVVPKEKYKYPSMEYNLFNLQKKDISDLLKKSKKDKVVTSLAVGLGLGGSYSEEVCLLSGIDKGEDPTKISEDDISKIISSIKNLLKNKKNPQIIYKNKEAVGVIPIALELYKDCENKTFSSFNDALDTYLTKEMKLEKKEESAYTKKINELKRIIEEQKDTIEAMGQKEIENRAKGESIYNNYKIISEILDEINKASKKYSWEEIKKKLKGHKIVKDVDVKDKQVVVDI